MTSTTHSEFGADTEALEVAAAFADRIHGRTVLVTGVNVSGIGFAAAEAFASQKPALVIIGGRSQAKLKESSDALRAKFPNTPVRPLILDLSSQEAVRAAAAEVLAWSDVPTIDYVINSAGVMLVPERTITEDGVELTFATNHVGHYLFSCLIMPKLLAGAAEKRGKGEARIVNISSLSPTYGHGIRWSDVNFSRTNKDLPVDEQPPYERLRMWNITDSETKSYVPFEAYGQSKVANVLFGIAATARLYDKHGVLSITAHPGIVRTELGRHADAATRDVVAGMFKQGLIQPKTLGAGASTGLVAALDPNLSKAEPKNGKQNWGSYFIDCQISDRATPNAESSEAAERLWALSEDLVKQKFAW